MTQHVHGYPDNEREWLESIVGRGAGDGDVYISPAEAEASRPKAESQNQDTTPALTSPMSTIDLKSKNYTGPKGKH